MARRQSQEPRLTLGNHIYLYGLLARELGCGKQTFLPRVEEVLAAERMAAEDLGFEDTRSLLEALDDCVTLTVFKGGRIYATVIAQPAWDEALAAPVDTKVDAAAKGGRPWKRKKSDKSLKPVKPRRVRREAEETVAESDAQPEAAETITEPRVAPEYAEQETANETVVEAADAAGTPEAATATEAASEAVFEPESETVQVLEAGVPVESETVTTREVETGTAPAAAAEPEPKPVAATQPEPEPAVEAPQPQPSISLTITYDPYSDSDEVTTLEASRTEPAGEETQNDAPSETEAAAAPKEVAPVAPPVAPASTPSPEALAGYPRDFAREVYCPTELLAELNCLLPLGTATMPLLAGDFQRALDLGLISGTRSRASFPLRVQHAESVASIVITIRKQTGPGLPWTISHVE